MKKGLSVAELDADISDCNQCFKIVAAADFTQYYIEVFAEIISDACANDSCVLEAYLEMQFAQSQY